MSKRNGPHATPHRSERRRLIAGAASLGLLAAPAAAQRAFEWRGQPGSAWDDSDAWVRVGGIGAPPGRDFPGALGDRDSAIFGGAGAYTVPTTTERSQLFLSRLAIRNPEAVVEIDRTTLVVRSVTGPGLLLVNRTGVFPELRLTPGGKLDTRVELRSDADLQGIAENDNPALITEDGLVTGRGSISGSVLNAGLIHARADETIRIDRTTPPIPFRQTPTGRVRVDPGGSLQLYEDLIGGSLEIGTDGAVLFPQAIDGVTISVEPGWNWFSGDPRVSDSLFATEFEIPWPRTLTLGPGNTLPADGFVVRGVLELEPGTVLDASVELRTLGSRGRLAGSGIIAAGTAVTGSGDIDNTVRNEGLIHAEDDGDVISFLNTGTTIEQSPDAVIRASNGGTLSIQGDTVRGGHLVIGANGTLLASTAALHGVTLTLEPGWTWGGTEGSLLLNDCVLGNTVFVVPPRRSLLLGSGNTVPDDGFAVRGTLGLGNHVELGVPVRLVEDGAGYSGGIIAPDSTVTVEASGTVNPFRNDGMIDVRLPGGRLAVVGSTLSQSQGGLVHVRAGAVLFGDQGTISGGTLRLDAGAALRIDQSDRLTLNGVTIDVDPDAAWSRGTLVVNQSEFIGRFEIRTDCRMFLGPGNTVHPDGILVTGGAFGAELLIATEEPIDFPIELDGAFASRAQLRAASQTTPRLAPESVITGVGVVTASFPELPGTIRPGTASDPGLIVLEIPGGSRFTGSTVLEIGFLSQEEADHGRLWTDTPLELAGTLRISTGSDFTPLSVFTLELISGAPVHGVFETIDYRGELGPNDHPRLFYEDDRVTFAVTCAADFALPAGLLGVEDVLAFLDVWTNARTDAGRSADLNADGSVDVLDVIDFLRAWRSGCPL